MSKKSGEARKKAKMREQIIAGGKNSVQNVIGGMFDIQKSDLRMECDESVKHARKSKVEGTVKTNMSVAAVDMMENQDMAEEIADISDIDSQCLLHAETPEQNEMLDAKPLCDTDNEPETQSTNYWELLSTLVIPLTQHEFGKIFPLMTENEFNDLVENIKKNGFHDDARIVMYEGKVLDGWHRYLALLVLGIFDPTLHCIEYERNDPVVYVVSKNKIRRQLDKSQSAMVAAKLANLQHGGNRKNQAANLPLDSTPLITQAEAAEIFNVGERLVRDAKVVLDSGDEEAIEDVMIQKVSVSKAAKTIRKAAKGRTQRKKAVKVNATKVNTTQPTPIPSEWMQAAKNTWWHIPVHGMCTRQEDISETIPYTIDTVRLAVETDPLTALISGLQDVQVSVNAGGIELAAEKIDSVFIAIETLKKMMEGLTFCCIDGLQEWSRIQKGDSDWTPFKGLPSYRKGKLHVMEIIKAVTHVLLSADWDSEQITETLITITGNDTTPDGDLMVNEVERNANYRASVKGKNSSVKGFKEVNKWLRERYNIDIPEA